MDSERSTVQITEEDAWSKVTPVGGNQFESPENLSGDFSGRK